MCIRRRGHGTHQDERRADSYGRAGGSWFEAPGCHHKISENESSTEFAKLLATMIVDTEVVEKGGVAALVVYDDEYKDVGRKA